MGRSGRGGDPLDTVGTNTSLQAGTPLFSLCVLCLFSVSTCIVNYIYLPFINIIMNSSYNFLPLFFSLSACQVFKMSPVLTSQKTPSRSSPRLSRCSSLVASKNSRLLVGDALILRASRR
jgi:hypothetical protein